MEGAAVSIAGAAQPPEGILERCGYLLFDASDAIDAVFNEAYYYISVRRSP